MPVNVDTMFSADLQVPWHGLGSIIKDAQLSEDAIKTAGLEWEVEKRPLFVQANETMISPKEWVATVRKDNNSVLGIVGPKYQVLQNREAFQFMDDLAGPGRLLQYETAGSLDLGRKVWMLATVKDLVIRPVKDDIVQPYLLLANGHDGRLELSILWTSVRVVCQNTLMLALKGNGTKYSMRHTQSLNDKKERARAVLGLTQEVVKKSEEGLQHLAALKIKGDEILQKVLMDVFPNDTPQAGKARDTVKELFEAGPGSQIPGVSGTGWGLLNAFTAYSTHLRTSRGGQENKVESVWWGSSNALNQKARDSILALV
jgi:phage/plasmid-like protein (TIGR03299 family)